MNNAQAVAVLLLLLTQVNDINSYLRYISLFHDACMDDGTAHTES